MGFSSSIVCRGFSGRRQCPAMGRNRATIDERGMGDGRIARTSETAPWAVYARLRGVWISPIVIHRLSTAVPRLSRMPMTSAAVSRNIRVLRAGNSPAKPSSCHFPIVTFSWAFVGSSSSKRWANDGIFWCFELYALPTVLSSQVEFSVVTIFFFLNLRRRTEGTGGSCPNSEPQKMPSFPHHSPIVF